MNKKLFEKFRSLRVLYFNEIKKCINAKTTFLVFLVIVFGVTVFALNIDSQPEQLIEANMQEVLSEEIENINSLLNDPSVDMTNEMRRNYIDTIKINSYMIENNIEPYKTHSIANYLLSINDLFAIVVILSILVVCKIVTDEFRYATMNILVTVPCKRYKILLAKVLAMISVCVGIIVLLYLISFFVGGIFFGFEGMDTTVVTYNNGKLFVRNIIEQSLINNFYNIFTLISCSSFVLMISLLFKSGVISACSGIIVYLIGSRVTMMLREFEWIKYSLFANMQFQMYTSGIEIFENQTPIFSIIVLLIYSVVFIAISFLIFNIRNIYD